MFFRLRQYASSLRFFRDHSYNKKTSKTSFTNHTNAMPVLAMPIIERLATDLKKRNQLPVAKNTFFVLAQHLLTTTPPLIKALIDHLGAQSGSIFVVGKRYSNNPTTIKTLESLGVYVQPNSELIGLHDFIPAYQQDINNMWGILEERVKVFRKFNRNIKPTVIIGDNGGYLLARTPRKILQTCNVIGFEQNISGKEAYAVPYPVIMTSNSIKQIVESPMVAKVVHAEILKTLPSSLTNPIFGILGFGAMGQALYRFLPKDRVLVYDKDFQKRTIERNSHVTDLTMLIIESDVIISCTGENPLSTMVEYLEMTRQPKWIFNAASASELLSLLQHVQMKKRNSPISQLTNISFRNSVGTKHVIAYGGYPINFRQALTTGESVSAQEIQFTRGLLFASFVQALHAAQYFENKKGYADCYQLDPVLQAKVAEAFFAENPSFAKEYGDATNQIMNAEWIRKNTGGTPMTGVIYDESHEQPLKLKF